MRRFVLIAGVVAGLTFGLTATMTGPTPAAAGQGWHSFGPCHQQSNPTSWCAWSCVINNHVPLNTHCCVSASGPECHCGPNS